MPQTTHCLRSSGNRAARQHVDRHDAERDQEVGEEADDRRRHAAGPAPHRVRETRGDAVQDPHRPRAAAEAEEHERIEQIERADGEAAVEDARASVRSMICGSSCATTAR